VIVPALIVDGDPRHGVVRYARALAGAVTARAGEGRAPDAVHLHFTDRLWGESPAAAARRVIEVAAGRRLTVTLHDVPQASDGPGGLARRIDGYRTVVAAAAGIVCNSHHEAALLRETGVLAGGEPAPAVIPLPVVPVADGPPATAPPADDPEVALLGYVYPGKGHVEAILAAAALPEPPAIRALGGPAPGHEGDLDALAALAARHGVAFRASGWLTDAELREACAIAAVPLAAHSHLSASASINDWIAAGRCPLVADSRYAREIDDLRPGTIRRYRPDGLAAALATALAAPATTWLAAGTPTRPHLPDVAAGYLDWWRRA
jgi:glycosyltransferase involved in cell wall biosynthesis